MTTRLVQVGDVVSDGVRCQVGEVNAIDGDRVEVCRPSGLTWWASKYHLRPATARERERLATNRQLRLKSLARTALSPPSSSS